MRPARQVVGEKVMPNREAILLLKVTYKDSGAVRFVVPSNSPCKNQRGHYWDLKPDFWKRTEAEARGHMKRFLLDDASYWRIDGIA